MKTPDGEVLQALAGLQGDGRFARVVLWVEESLGEAVDGMIDKRDQRDELAGGAAVLREFVRFARDARPLAERMAADSRREFLAGME